MLKQSSEVSLLTFFLKQLIQLNTWHEDCENVHILSVCEVIHLILEIVKESKDFYIVVTVFC
jgi:hypothetical protein